jgi:hypothetical protein
MALYRGLIHTFLKLCSEAVINYLISNAIFIHLPLCQHFRGISLSFYATLIICHVYLAESCPIA